MAGAAHPGGNRSEQRVAQLVLDRLDHARGQAGGEQPHAAGDVEPHAAGGDDAAFLRVEGGHAADGESIAPVRVGQRKRRFDDPRQRGYVGDLLEHLVVHRLQQRTVGEDDRRHAHGAERLYPPLRRTDAHAPGGVHRGLLPHTSTTHWARHAPSGPWPTASCVSVAPFGSTAG